MKILPYLYKIVKGAKSQKSCPTIGHLGEITRLLVAYKLVSSFIEKLESDKTDLLYFTNVSSGCVVLSENGVCLWGIFVSLILMGNTTEKSRFGKH